MPMYGVLLSRLAGALSCYLELLDKLQKCICRTVGSSLAVFLEPLAHPQNVASISFFVGITLVDVLQNWFKWSTSFFSREIYSLF